MHFPTCWTPSINIKRHHKQKWRERECYFCAQIPPQGFIKNVRTHFCIKIQDKFTTTERSSKSKFIIIFIIPDSISSRQLRFTVPQSFHTGGNLGAEIHCSCQSGLKEWATYSRTHCVPAQKVIEREDLVKECFFHKQNKSLFLMSLTEKLDSLAWWFVWLDLGFLNFKLPFFSDWKFFSYLLTLNHFYSVPLS